MSFYQIYFKSRPSKKYYIACEIANGAYKHEIIANLFDDDDSVNHLVTFSDDQVEQMDLLLNRCIGNIGIVEGIIGYDIFGIDIRYIEGWANFKYQSIKNQKSLTLGRGDFKFLDNITALNKDQSITNAAREIINTLLDRFQLNSERELSQVLRVKYMNPIQEEYDKACNRISKWREEVLYKDLPSIEENYVERNKKRKQHNQRLKDKIELVYNELIKKEKIPTKWKSEYELFKLVSKNFPDAIYQHIPHWLSPQSFDIYVPSINTAFEYQGIQHYEPVEYFGGEDAYFKRVELDKKKKKISIKQGVNLIYWGYYEPISILILKRKLKEIGIEL